MWTVHSTPQKSFICLASHGFIGLIPHLAFYMDAGDLISLPQLKYFTNWAMFPALAYGSVCVCVWPAFSVSVLQVNPWCCIFQYFKRSNNTLHMNIPHFLYSFVNESSSFFDILATVDDTAMSIRVQLSLQDLHFSSLWCTSRSGIAGSYGNSIFKSPRNHHTLFHCSCYHFIFTPGVQVFWSPHPSQHLLFSVSW